MELKQGRCLWSSPRGAALPVCECCSSVGLLTEGRAFLMCSELSAGCYLSCWHRQSDLPKLHWAPFPAHPSCPAEWCGPCRSLVQFLSPCRGFRKFGDEKWRVGGFKLPVCPFHCESPLTLARSKWITANLKSRSSGWSSGDGRDRWHFACKEGAFSPF